jgi:predicted transcriptional regulator
MDLKEYLDSMGIRYNHFAEQIGISYKTLWEILNGNGPKKMETAQKIVEITKGEVKMKDLMEGRKKSD